MCKNMHKMRRCDFMKKQENESFSIDEKKLELYNEMAWQERVSKKQMEPDIDISSYLVNQGFEIIRADLPDSITGILLVDETNEEKPLKVIAIKKGKEKPQSRFIVAHEYAHAFLHKKGTLQFAHRDYENLANNQQEQEAEAFARCFLMPKELIIPLCTKFKEDRDLVNKKTSKEDLIEFVRNNFDVTVKKANQRIRELKICEELHVPC